MAATANVEAAPEGAPRGTAVYLWVEVARGEVDGAVEKVREAGGVVTMEAADVAFGEYKCRIAKCLDPYGVAWTFALPAHSADAPAVKKPVDGQAA
jgi:uncharacterized glyoxalase superfamily protein PhnB